MKPIHILLVEDDELDVIEITRSLDKLNLLYQLTHARNGEDALDILENGSVFGAGELPDITLVDLNMPKMNGLEFLEQVRSTEKWKHLKCFVITTSSETAERTAAAALGVSGYIVKPLKLHTRSNMDALNLVIDLMNISKED